MRSCYTFVSPRPALEKTPDPPDPFDFPKWDQIFKDPMTTAAAIDRLVHHSVILELNVPSYRAEQAKKARQTPPGPTNPSKEG